MARLSIIIPVLGQLKRLEDTLVSVLENRPANCQILVVFNQPYDDPYDLKGEVTIVEAAGGCGFAQSCNAGLSAAAAPVVHVLSCGVSVTPGWADAALRPFDTPDVAAVAPVVLDRGDPTWVLSAGIAYRPGGRVQRLTAEGSPDCLSGPDTLAGFYRKSALESVSGLRAGLGDSVAGVDLALRLHHAGYRLIVEPDCRAYADRALVDEPPSLRRGIEEERLFWRWAPAAGWLSSLTRHGGLVAWECARCLVRPTLVCKLAGRAWGGLQLASHRQHWRSLRQPERAPSEMVPAPHFVTDCRKPVAHV